MRALPPILLPLGFFLAHASYFQSWIVDDAGISFAYAYNLIHGHGLVAQAGLEPVEGFSNPLWTVLISPLFIQAPQDPTFIIKLFSYGLVLASFYLVSRICYLLFEESWLAFLCATLALFLAATNTSYVVWAVSGLENPLNGLLLAAYVYVSLVANRSLWNQAFNRLPIAPLILAGVLSSLMALTRPDGLVYLGAFPLLYLIECFRKWEFGRKHVSALAIFSLCAVLPLALYVVFRVSYFGDFYPNTYHVKGGPSLWEALKAIALTKVYFYKNFGLISSLFGSASAMVCLLILVSSISLIALRFKTNQSILLLPFLFLSWFIYMVLPYDWMGEYRFASNFFLILSVYIGVLFSEFVKLPQWPARGQKVVLAGVGLSIILLSAKIHYPRTVEYARDPALSMKKIAYTFGQEFNQFAEALDIENASFLTPDLGGSLYYSKHRIYDLMGLCDREVAQAIKHEDNERLRDYIFAEKPTFIHTPQFHNIRNGLLADKRLEEFYTPIRFEDLDENSTWDPSEARPGDYVLKDAVKSEAQLEALRVQLADQPFYAKEADYFYPEPFPRTE